MDKFNFCFVLVQFDNVRQGDRIPLYLAGFLLAAIQQVMAARHATVQELTTTTTMMARVPILMLTSGDRGQSVLKLMPDNIFR